jgi:biotin carboxylase
VLPSLGVVADFGSASPMSVLAAARGLARIVFLCDRDRPYVRDLFDELTAIGPVCDITGRSDDEVTTCPQWTDLAGITTFSESQLVRTAALAERRGWTFLSPHAAHAVTDKYRQRQLLAGAGVGITRCRPVRTADDVDAALAEVGLPAILKPRSGAASARTCRVDTVAEARARLREFASSVPGPGIASPDFVVEEVLVGDPAVAGPGWGDYVSVESVTSHGETRHIQITGKFPLAEPLRETGYVVPSTLGAADRRAVLALTTAAVAALGIRHGATHVELKLTPAGPRVIEVNGRVGGYVADLIRRARGYDLVRAALRAALGLPDPAGGLPDPAGGYRRHAFQYFVTPPMNATALRSLDGVEELLDRRGIHLVEQVREPGQALDWRQGTLAYVAIVHGSGVDHDDVLRLVDVIDNTLKVEYTV